MPDAPINHKGIIVDERERSERPERSERSERQDLAPWLSALESRHLADLRVPEVTRALRALSSAYVERRQTLQRGAALDSAGKRAAFALFYGPLHYLVVSHVVGAIGATPVPASILDVGCGTGAAGVAWAASFAGRMPSVTGLDRHPWAVEEALWTYRHFQVNGRARRSDLTRLPRVPSTSAVIAAYLLNELTEDARGRVQDWLLDAADRGAQVLVIEPLARGAAPWWDAFADRVTASGGRVDEWRFLANLPPFVRLLDRSAGLDHSALKARSAALNMSH